MKKTTAMAAAITFILIAAVCLAPASYAQQSVERPGPGPENEKMAVWFGEWTYEGSYATTPLGPGYSFSGRMSGRPLQKGFAGEFIYDEKGPDGETRFFEIDFWDPSLKAFSYVYLGNDGYVERGTFTMKGRVTEAMGIFVLDSKSVRIRSLETTAADGQSFTRKLEICVDGKAWMPYSNATFTKVADQAK